MSDWQKLRARYGSKNQYKNRIAVRPSEIENFAGWLADNGADVLTSLAQDEILRFRMNGDIGIVWRSNTGNLLAHDCADKWRAQS